MTDYTQLLVPPLTEGLREARHFPLQWLQRVV